MDDGKNAHRKTNGYRFDDLGYRFKSRHESVTLALSVVLSCIPLIVLGFCFLGGSQQIDVLFNEIVLNQIDS